MKNIGIRMADPEDAAALLDIYSYYVKNTAITYEYDVPSVAEFKERIRHTLEKYPYIVAIDNSGEANSEQNIFPSHHERIVGYAYAGCFKSRAAYDWSVETSIYVAKDAHNMGIGKQLYVELEKQLKDMNILNVNACIACTQSEDEYLTNASIRFHEKSGYNKVGIFHQCAYKFGRWYDMIWMEKFIGEHIASQPDVIWGKAQKKETIL